MKSCWRQGGLYQELYQNQFGLVSRAQSAAALGEGGDA